MKQQIIVFAAVVFSLLIVPNTMSLTITPANFDGTMEHGQSYTNHFRIVPDNLSQDIMLYGNSPFDVKFAQDQIIGLSTYFDMDFNITVPENFPDGTYKSRLFVFGEGETKMVNVTLTIVKNSSYETIFEPEINVTAGETNYTPLKIRNTGNTRIVSSLSIISPDIQISFDEDNFNSFIIYPNTTVEIPIVYYVPESIPEGEYITNITLTTNTANSTKNVAVKFVTNDDIPPVIKDIIYNETIHAGEDFKICVKASDNINISKVMFRMMADGLDENYTTSTLSDGGCYSITSNIKAVGNVDMEVIVNDTYGNTFTAYEILKLVRYDKVLFQDFDFIKISKNEPFRFMIFDSGIIVPFCININYVDFLPNKTHDYFFYIDDIKRYIDVENMTCFDGSRLEFVFKPEEIGRMDAEFLISFEDWVQHNKTVNLAAQIADNSVRETHELMFGENSMTCNYTSDKWECYLDYSGNTQLEDLGMPLTVREYKNVIQAANQTAERLEFQLGNLQGTTNILSIIIVILVAIGTIYYIFVVKGVQLLGVGG